MLFIFYKKIHDFHITRWKHVGSDLVVIRYKITISVSDLLHTPKDYEDKIEEYLKQQSTEKLNLLIKSEIISPEKGSRLKEGLWNTD